LCHLQQHGTLLLIGDTVSPALGVHTAAIDGSQEFFRCLRSLSVVLDNLAELLLSYVLTMLPCGCLSNLVRLHLGFLNPVTGSLRQLRVCLVLVQDVRVNLTRGDLVLFRSEERRVGKECRSWWSTYH